MHSTTNPIQEIVGRRLETGLADLLLTVADYFYCKGAGVPVELPATTGTADLLILVEARHQAEVLALRGWLDPPTNADDLPGWLLSLPQQADPIRLRAAAERQLALGDAAPLEVGAYER